MTKIEQPERFVIVIFGASGDLARRKLLPALYEIYHRNLIDRDVKILGVGRSFISNDDFRLRMIEIMSGDDVQEFASNIYYHQMDISQPSDYESLKIEMESLCRQMSCSSNYLYYFAIPPQKYSVVAENLHGAGLSCEDGGWKRIVVEKPFGHSLQSARELNRNLLKYFRENQIFRIDHYLGKETVQNILVTRFSNSIFEPLWNRNYVEYVEITSSESIGVGSRAGYYDTSGAMRDMVQNHLLQVLGMVAMESPVSAGMDDIRNEMLKVFKSLRMIPEGEIPLYTVRGQYAGYRDEMGVKSDSRTETYVAIKCMIDNWRWSGVPFYIRTGKFMPTRVTEVVIHFRPNPQRMFVLHNTLENVRNQMIIRIQPDEGIILKFGMKVPGSGFHVDTVSMDFHYSTLTDSYIPEAYQRLLCDVMQGDATLFQRGDALEATWQFVQPLLDAWENNPELPLYSYPRGSWGPEQADELLRQDGFEWRYPCKNLSNDNNYCEL